MKALKQLAPTPPEPLKSLRSHVDDLISERLATHTLTDTQVQKVIDEWKKRQQELLSKYESL